MSVVRTDHLTELACETIDAEGHHCWECHDTAPGDRLLAFFTQRGAKARQHDGLFCSKDCHDRYHGLKPKR